MIGKQVRGWCCFPVADRRVLLHPAGATAASAGRCFWGLNWVFHLRETGGVLNHSSWCQGSLCIRGAPRSFGAGHQHLPAPALTLSRAYEVEFRRGLPHRSSVSLDASLLHVPANTGNIRKEFLVHGDLLLVKNVRARIRLPRARPAKSLGVMWSGKKSASRVRNGGTELIILQAEVYEIIRADLA